MSLKNILESTKLKSPKFILYGPAGIGKTTFGASLPAPILVPTEDGLGKINVKHFPVAKTFDELIGNLKSLLDEEHEFKSVILDSLDWAEQLWEQKTCDVLGFKTIEAAGYGRGYKEAVKFVDVIIDILGRLRDEKNMVICLIAHAEIKRFEAVTVDPYDRYQIKLNKRACARFMESVDAIFFANYKLGTVKTQGNKGQTHTKTVQGDRVLFTEERPEFVAKNRYALPAEMEMNWEAVREEIIK